ncbi:sigma-70 family RNA polymerase sigma factor [Alteromonas sediminis]|uniref:Sigma-70 family RNA polymerase sigma factor n=1 Tax=Alteromonas sediminis TaxID=2259342 RepID=A0A3N5YBT7_9ALTE|nr:sigma-70 family RNA polymerase sigma factor [Alteromonas sediminis]RPJ66565.1 sigma-70 family RNA polymerase sigma factor [Alteromonas sediminis]
MIKEKNNWFETLVHDLHADLYRYALFLTKDKATAEDVLQETFFRAWRALDSLKDKKVVKSWLITILRRENARRFERKRFDMFDLDEMSVVGTDDQDRNIEVIQIRKAISQLAPKYSEPLMLQVMFGFNCDEIAHLLALNKNTVMTRLFRARALLKIKIKPTYQDEYMQAI